jgi:hypothetical protein
MVVWLAQGYHLWKYFSRSITISSRCGLKYALRPANRYFQIADTAIQVEADMVALRQTDEDFGEYGTGIEPGDLENVVFTDPTAKKLEETDFAKELENRGVVSGILRSGPVLKPQQSLLIDWLESSVKPAQGASKVEVAGREIGNSRILDPRPRSRRV